jgi:hypothetical protein
MPMVFLLPFVTDTSFTIQPTIKACYTLRAQTDALDVLYWMKLKV